MLWQATVILLPIVVLVGVGFYVLKQDRAAVTEEARQRASGIARDLSERLGLQIATEFSRFEGVGSLWAGDGIAGGCWVHWPGRSPLTAENLANYQRLLAEWQADYPDLRAEDVFPIQARLTETGEMELPKDYPNPPAPAPWLTELSTEQQSLWHAANHLRLNSNDTNAVRGALEEFLDSAPSKPAKANAEFALVLLELHTAPAAERWQRLIRFGGQHSAELSESGLPVAALALGRGLQEAASLGLTEELFNALGEQAFRGDPSFLSAHLLAEGERLAAKESDAVRRAVQEVRLRWESQERLRELVRRVREILVPTAVLTANVWFKSGGQRWFAILNPGETQLMTSTNGQPQTFTNRVTNLRFFPERAVKRATDLALGRTAPRLPEYFAAQLSVEDERVVSAKVQDPPPLLLAQGEGRMSLPGVRLPSDRPDEELRFGSEFETWPSQPRFSAAIYLVDPARLYAQARRRAAVFGALILAAAGLAVAGVARMFQALIRQQRLNEMKSNFVSSVSHELRAPIASMRLMAEGLENGRIKDEQKRQEYFKFIVQECRRLASLVENVLDFSRIEKGRKEYEFEPVDIAVLAAQTLKLMQTYADERKVCLQIAPNNLQLATRNFQLLANGRALQQALVNLIDNAIKHAPAGTTVTIGLNPGSDTNHSSRRTHPAASRSHGSGVSGPSLHLWVEDHGPGIPFEEHDRIFERFYRRGSELRRETQGVGIGLSIVKHIVEAHGGRVLVRSAVGEGSRFTIELPLKNLETR